MTLYQFCGKCAYPKQQPSILLIDPKLSRRASDLLGPRALKGDREMEWLKGTNLDGGTKDRKEMLEREYEQVLGVVEDEEFRHELTWELYLWACNVISSRCFPNKLIEPDEVELNEALFPLADSLNHRPRQRITWKVQGRSALHLITEDGIEAGEQVFNNYGTKSNEELLIGYGFCIPDNPDDWVAIKVNFTQDPLRDQKLAVLSQLGISELTHFIKKNIIPPDLFAQLGVLAMNANEIKIFQQMSEKASIKEKIFGYRCEIAMLELFSLFLRKKFELIKDRDDEFWNDEGEGLSTEGLSKLGNAKIYIDGQREILETALRTIASREIWVLENASRDFRDGRINLVFILGDNVANVVVREPLNAHINRDSNLDATKMELLDSIMITFKIVMLDDEFSEAMREVFDGESLMEEEDVVLMLYLICESKRVERSQKSRWKLFIETIREYEDTSISQEKIEEIVELYNDLNSSILSSSKCSKMFTKDVFNVNRLIWATSIFENCCVNYYDREGRACVGILPL
ncbi:17519_t:CDS:2 [Acaulospora colombiana]|uniref:17519_t:CDS:1 n=1 Tax=Acaulospora colombiana TaxID=27376 RepID=A0ACA9KD23_9GLOM|nr:17519_t:CDS:2 [Acaulospora colombiana]